MINPFHSSVLISSDCLYLLLICLNNFSQQSHPQDVLPSIKDMVKNLFQPDGLPVYHSLRIVAHALFSFFLENQNSINNLETKDESYLNTLVKLYDEMEEQPKPEMSTTTSSAAAGPP